MASISVDIVKDCQGLRYQAKVAAYNSTNPQVLDQNSITKKPLKSLKCLTLFMSNLARSRITNGLDECLNPVCNGKPLMLDRSTCLELLIRDLPRKEVLVLCSLTLMYHC